ncbi:MAG TPA: SH3 domain-containing protein [Anaerolineae bacterium]|nr:SH3 domain-containing protein [Anaerolineae bacterium]
MSATYRVIKSYQSPYTAPLTLPKGGRLRWEPRECEWPVWIWCTTGDGESRWVPEHWVEKEGEFCVLQRDYTATELSVEEGETVTVVLVENGWGWATNEGGESGRVPLVHLEPK